MTVGTEGIESIPYHADARGGRGQYRAPGALNSAIPCPWGTDLLALAPRGQTSHMARGEASGPLGHGEGVFGPLRHGRARSAP